MALPVTDPDLDAELELEALYEEWDMQHQEPVSLYARNTGPGLYFYLEGVDKSGIPSIRYEIEVPAHTELAAVFFLNPTEDVAALLSATCVEFSTRGGRLAKEAIDGEDLFTPDDLDEEILLAVLFLGNTISDNSTTIEWLLHRYDQDEVLSWMEFLETARDFMAESPGLDMYLYVTDLLSLQDML